MHIKDDGEVGIDDDRSIDDSQIHTYSYIDQGYWRIW